MTSLEIRAFQDTDLNFITQLARLEDFAPGVGDIAIYANTGSQAVWVASQNEAPVGCIAAVKYNPDYGFIGLLWFTRIIAAVVSANVCGSTL